MDVVLFCVKSYDTDGAARGCRRSSSPTPPSSPPERHRQRGPDRGGHRLGARPWWRRLHLRRGHLARVVVASGPRSIVFGEWTGGTTTPGSGASSRRLGPVGSARRVTGMSRSSSGRSTCCWRRCRQCPRQPSSRSATSAVPGCDHAPARPDDRGAGGRSRLRRRPRRRPGRPPARLVLSQAHDSQRRSRPTWSAGTGWRSTPCRARPSDSALELGVRLADDSGLRDPRAMATGTQPATGQDHDCRARPARRRARPTNRESAPSFTAHRL